jgi:TolA-binding protein
LASALAALAAAGLGSWFLLPRTPGEQALFELAGRFRRAELFAEAAAAYERIVEKHPEGALAAAACLAAADCRQCLGHWRQAEALCEQCRQRFPEQESGAQARERLRTLARVIHYAELAGEKNLPAAKCAEALYDMGLLVRDRVNPHMAARILAEAADRFPQAPQAPEARHAAGMILLDLCRPVEAREQFAKLVAAQPGSRLAGDAQFWIGHTHEAQGRLLAGLDPDARLLEKATDPDAAGLRADLRLRRRYDPGAVPPGEPLLPPGLGAGERRARGRQFLTSAVRAYQRVVDAHRLSAKAPKALLRIGEINARCLKNADAATEAYRQLLEMYPGTPEAVGQQCEVGRAYMRKGQPAEAERILKLFLVSFPNHEECGDALLHLAECHRQQREYVKALDDYQSYLARCPDSPRAAEVREEIAWLQKYRL